VTDRSDSSERAAAKANRNPVPSWIGEARIHSAGDAQTSPAESRSIPPTYAFQPVSTPLFLALSARESLPKVTTILAPPGFGKTVFMSQIFRKYGADGIQCHWLALDERDSSLVSLIRRLELMIGISPPEVAETFQTSDITDRIEIIRVALTKTSRPCILFVDNIDFCTDPGVGRLLDTIAFDTPQGIKLVVSSSSMLVPVNTARARLELNLQTITALDLCFDSRATRELFAQVGLTDIEPAILDAIVEKTEGWPAALRLLQLTIDSKKSIEQGLDLLPPNEGHLADLLSRRLMSTFEPDLVAFLYEIAEFRQFSAEMALAATGNQRAHQWIKFLVDRNIMIIPLDQKYELFRFHTLFRQFLINEAHHHHSPDRRSEVLATAARWLTKRRDYKGAFELAVNARDRDLVSELLELTAGMFVREQGDTSAFIDFIERAEAIGTRRGLQANFWYVWALLFERRFRQAKEEIRTAFAYLVDSGSEAASKELSAKLLLADIVIGVHLDMPDSVEVSAKNWLRVNTDAEAFDTAAAAGAFAISRLCRHDYATARNALRTSQASIAQSDSTYGRCWVSIIEGLREVAQGDPALAAARLLEIEQRAKDDIAPTASIVSVVAVVRARALYECGDLASAQQLAADHLRRAVENGIPDTTWAGVDVLIPSAVLGTGAFTIEQLRSIVREYPRRVGNLFELAVVNALIAAERIDEAQARASDMGWTPRSGWAPPFLDGMSEMEQSAARVVSAALMMKSGHLEESGELIQGEIRLAEDTGRRRDQINLHLLNAQLCCQSSFRSGSLRAIARAISLTAKREIYAPFLRHGSLVAHLLGNTRPKELGLVHLDEQVVYTKVLRLVGVSAPVSYRHDDEHGSNDPPTPRELELLYMLEAGLDNSQIADRLHVSVRTIKWHLSNLYLKLGVKSRSSAVARGRALRILRS
jgi:LuxR family maltose regulon positive regulatory protein